MSADDWLTSRFEENRSHLRAVAYRMLGSPNEADDAVQEAWLRLHRSDIDGVENLGGWLTTTVARVCLDMLRSRRSRREEPMDAGEPESAASREPGADPEYQAVLADSVGPALLVVLDTLAPAERLAFVLHDMFAVPFEEIAPIVDRSPAATRQLASRARRRVRGATDTRGASHSTLARQRRVVAAFLAASRDGDFDALLAVLDPDVVVRADAAAVRSGASAELRGARKVAESYRGRARAVVPALVDGVIGGVFALDGRPRVVLRFTIEHDLITGIEAYLDPERMARFDIQLLKD
jgi:RNA polymerase sigma-70 factor (ECF subfamily)